MTISKHKTELGEFYILDNDRWIGRTIKQGKAWDADKIKLLSSYINKDSIVLDIGANIGTHSIPYSKIAKQIIAFEPQKVIYKLLQMNAQLNKCNNINFQNTAVGHFNGRVSLSSRISDGKTKGKKITYNSVEDINYGGIEIGLGGEKTKMITIDSLELKNVDLIKIDIEGCEKMAIWGAKKTIERCRPVVIYEFKKDVSDEMKKTMNIPKEILDFNIYSYFIDELGYQESNKMKWDLLFIP